MQFLKTLEKSMNMLVVIREGKRRFLIHQKRMQYGAGTEQRKELCSLTLAVRQGEVAIHVGNSQGFSQDDSRQKVEKRTPLLINGTLELDGTLSVIFQMRN